MKNKIFFFSGKYDFPRLHFDNAKTPSQDYFWVLNFYLLTNFQNILWHFFQLLESERMT